VAVSLLIEDLSKVCCGRAAWFAAGVAGDHRSRVRFPMALKQSLASETTSVRASSSCRRQFSVFEVQPSCNGRLMRHAPPKLNVSWRRCARPKARMNCVVGRSRARGGLAGIAVRGHPGDIADR
jgi:hypothetical protein